MNIRQQNTNMKILLFALIYVVIIFKEIPAHQITFRPCGVRRCENKCHNIVGCAVVYYSSNTLWCQIMGRNAVLNDSNTQIKRVKANPRNGPCAACPHMSMCVLTWTGSLVCVVQRHTNSGGPDVLTKGRTRTEIRFQKGKGLQQIGLLIVSKTRRLSLIDLNKERKWIFFPFGDGKITDMESHGNNVYYCHGPPHYCSKFEYREKMEHLIRKPVYARVFAVDEKVDTIFAGGFTRLVVEFTLVWKSRKVTHKLRGIATHLKTSPEKRLLYAAFREFKFLNVLDYHGRVKFSISARYKAYSMDIDAAGTQMYTTDGRDTLTVIYNSDSPFCTKKYIEGIGTSKHNNTRVFATGDRVLILAHGILTVRDKDGTLVDGESMYTLQKHMYELSAPVALFTGTVGLNKSSKTRPMTEFNHVCGYATPFPERVLIAVSKVLHGHEVTTLNTLDLDTGQWPEIGHFIGRLVDLDISEDAGYRCQESPTGLYITMLKNGYWHSSAQKRLSLGIHRSTLHINCS